jgi:hypothetical protein
MTDTTSARIHTGNTGQVYNRLAPRAWTDVVETLLQGKKYVGVAQVVVPDISETRSPSPSLLATYAKRKRPIV